MEQPSNRREAGIGFILITIFIDILGIGIVIPVLPELIKELIDGDESSASVYVGVISASYALMQFICSPIVGSLSDRFGRRPILLASLFGLGVDFVIQGFAPNITWLFIGRLLAGMMGASITTANAYIADISTPETRARNFGLVGAMFGLGFICGPLIGGITGSYHLRLPFFIAAAIALLNWLYGFFILPESLDEKHRSKFAWSKANQIGSLDQLLKYPIVAGLAIPYVCMSLAQRGLENVWVLFTAYRYGWDEKTNGLALGLVGLMATIVQGGMVRPIIKRFGERRALSGGLLLCVVTFVAYGWAPYAWMIPCIIIFGAFGYVTGPAMQTIITENVPPNEQGKIQGALTALTSLTNIFAPVVFTMMLFGFFTSDKAPIKLPGIPFYVGAVFWLLAWVIVQRVFARFPEKPKPPISEDPVSEDPVSEDQAPEAEDGSPATDQSEEPEA